MRVLMTSNGIVVYTVTSPAIAPMPNVIPLGSVVPDRVLV